MFNVNCIANQPVSNSCFYKVPAGYSITKIKTAKNYLKWQQCLTSYMFKVDPSDEVFTWSEVNSKLKTGWLRI